MAVTPHCRTPPCRSAARPDTITCCAPSDTRVEMAAKNPKASPPPAAAFDPTNPFIVQSDRSVLVEVDNPKYGEARDALAPFAELEKSPEHIHTYRITDLSLWNAAAAGMTAAQMLEVLAHYSKFPLPTNLAADVEE